VIWLVAAVLAVVAGVRLFGAGDAPAPPVSIDGGPGEGASDGAARDVAGPAGASGHTAAPGELYVHVAGAVRRPGLVRLPAGTRVAAALDRVGGPTRRADLTLVNLAARVQDGQQIVVPVVATASPASGGGPAGAAAGTPPGTAPGVKVHLSTATSEQLDGIDGIGPTLAERIIEYRDAHGGFRSLQELAEVEGIGEKRLATLREALQP
jgi:competence protein ComEA